MRNIISFIVFACIEQVHVKELSGNRAAIARGNSVDTVATKLVDRVFKTGPLDLTGLESAMLAKTHPSTVSTRLGNPSRPAIPYTQTFHGAHTVLNAVTIAKYRMGARSTSTYSAEASTSDTQVKSDLAAPYGRDKLGRPKALLLWDGA